MNDKRWSGRILPIILVVQGATEENIQRATKTLDNFYAACHLLQKQTTIVINTLVCSTKCHWLQKRYLTLNHAKKYLYKVSNRQTNLKEMVCCLKSSLRATFQHYQPIVFFFLTNSYDRTTLNHIRELKSFYYQTVVVDVSDTKENELLTTVFESNLPRIKILKSTSEFQRTSKFFYSLLLNLFVREKDKFKQMESLKYTLDWSLLQQGPTPKRYLEDTQEAREMVAASISERSEDKPSPTEPYFKNTGLINYAIISEHEIKRNEPFIINFITFIDKYKIIVASYMDNFKDPTVKKGVLSDVKENSEITIRFYAPDVPSINDVQTFIWDGKYNVSEFHGLINDSYKGNSLLLAFDVLVNGIKIAAIKSVVDLEKNTKGIMKLFKEGVRRVFFSYSSKDRKTVLQIVKKTVDITGSSIQFFLDALSLRAGDNWQDKIYEAIDDCDSFCLIWSYSAYRSKWVKKEWEYALNKKGLNAFNPININNEKKCHVPIPRKLSSIHFANYGVLIKNK